MSRLYHSSRPDSWTVPRQAIHASERYYRHGPIQPMQEPGLLGRWFRRG